jgi:replicative DNA helicase
MAETLNSTLQVQVLSLLMFSPEHSKLVRHSIELDNWAGDVGISKLVDRLYFYIDTYKECAGDHAYAIAADLPISEDKIQNLLQLIQNCEIGFESINKDFVVTQLEKFQRKAVYQDALFKAVEAWEKEDLDKVEEIFLQAPKQRQKLFDPGMRLSEILQTLNKPEEEKSEDCIPLFIEPLDRRGLVPRRKEMILFMAKAKAGKSWFLTHCGKQALLHNKKVCHISLEMNDEQVGSRYLQSIYALTTRTVNGLKVMKLRDGYGFDTYGMPNEQESPRSLTDCNVIEKIAKRLDQERYIDKNLWIKKFPTRSLTIQGLTAYLESLATHYDFYPDLLLLDYADLMKIDINNYRQHLGSIYQDLHGLAAERNIMVVTATQSNKEGASAKVMLDVHVSENWSKIAIADLVLTYSQTDAEKALGLARLNVSNARNEQDGFQILITQSYALGQFCLEAQEHTDFWKEKLKSLLKEAAPEETFKGKPEKQGVYRA